MNKIFWVFIVAVVLVISGCTLPSSTSDKGVTEKAQAVLEALQSSDVEKIIAHYDENFYVTRSPQQWREELTALFSQHGKVARISMRNKQADTRFSGKFYIYQFDTLHDNDKRARHTLTIIRPVNEPEQVVIVGHQIK